MKIRPAFAFWILGTLWLLAIVSNVGGSWRLSLWFLTAPLWLGAVVLVLLVGAAMLGNFILGGIHRWMLWRHRRECERERKALQRAFSSQFLRGGNLPPRPPQPNRRYD